MGLECCEYHIDSAMGLECCDHINYALGLECSEYHINPETVLGCSEYHINSGMNPKCCGNNPTQGSGGEHNQPEDPSPGGSEPTDPGSPTSSTSESDHPDDPLPPVDYNLNSNPSWSVTAALGFQHGLVAIGATVIIPTMIVPLMGGGTVEKAKVVQTAMFVSGLNTLLQTWFGTRLPVVMRGSFRFIMPSLCVALSHKYFIYLNPYARFLHTMRAIQGALIIASILPMLLGFLGIWGTVVRYLSPLSSVPLVTLVGLGLHEQGFPRLAECVEIGLPELIILVLFAYFIPNMSSCKRPFYDRFAVLLSVGIVWAFAALLTVAGAYKNRPLQTQLSCRVDRSGLVRGSSWISIPYPLQWGQPKIHAEDVLVMLAAAFVAMIESTGSFIAASRYAGVKPVPASVLSRGIGWLGVGMFLDGLFGTGSGSTASVESVGLMAMTRVGSRRVTQISAVFMLSLSVLGKSGAVIASIPLPIVGAIYCVLFALMSSGNLGLLQHVNLNSYRTKFIIGFSFFMGHSVPRYFAEYVLTNGHGPVHTQSLWFNNVVLVIFTSPATVAGIIAYFLDLTLAREHVSTKKDSGRRWGLRVLYFAEDPRNRDYTFPFDFSDYFSSW